MALAAVYQQFLAAPNPSHLAENATLNYITTTTTFRGSSEIVQHLTTLRKQINKKKENVLSLVHGQNAIAIEIETGLEFVTSGASYLPALDDNFLADRTVYLPIMHVVTFDENEKIVNIRQSWDQGALLKQLDIIGKTGRNWPIRDSKEQIRMIESCVKAATGATSSTQTSAAIPDRSRGKPTNALRDPHASLSLFQSREEQEETLASVISPKSGIRPRQRDFTEILGDEPDDAPPSPSAGRTRSASPSKAIAPRAGPRPRQRDFVEILGDEPAEAPESSETAHDKPLARGSAIAPKAGAGKNFQPSRLFETDEGEDQNNSPDDVKSPDRFYRPHPKKFNHFEFADGSDPQDAPQPDPTPRKTKHNSQWSFDDFVTPAKVKPSKVLRHQETHQWEADDEEASQTQPQGKPRRDAETHFEFVDDGNAPVDNRPVRPRGATHNTGLGLYQNNLYDEEGNAVTPTQGQKPLGTITNLKDRGRDFDSHWVMTDDPSPEKPQSKATVSDDRQKAVKMMESNWAAYDESPVQKENKPAAARNGSKQNDERGIAIGGDGMGGNRGSSRNWLFSDEDDTQTTRPVPGRKQPASKTGGFNWDF
ncbi:hypothetical protein F5Y01DRAFT_287162 [Xylaria sp. FL0043]|nr:hypothetical protein F5Y01DRAFT_287162 [Xylaria sp. FL0043]